MKKILAVVFVLFCMLANVSASTAEDYISEATTYYKNSDFANAISSFEKALAIYKETVGEEHPNTVQTYYNIGYIYHIEGHYDKALEYYDRALNVQKKNFGEENSGTAKIYTTIGLVYWQQRDYDSALVYFGKVLDIKKKIFGEEHADTAACYYMIGGIYDEKGAYDKALEYYGQALDIQMKIFGEEHADTAESYSQIGSCYASKDDYDRALEYLGRALDIRKKLFGEEHPDTARAYGCIGIVYRDKGDYNRALEYCTKALDIGKKVLGEYDSDDLAGLYLAVGDVYSAQGDYNRALEHFLGALDIQRKVFGEDSSDTATSYSYIGSVYHDKGDYDRALEYYGKALDINKKVLGEDCSETATSYNQIGSNYAERGDYDRALEYFLRALDIWKKLFGEEHSNTARAYNNIGNVYDEKWNYDRALEYHEKALAIRKKVLGEEHADTAESYYNMGLVFFDKKDYDKALEYLVHALDIRKKLLGEEHPVTANAYSLIGSAYSDKGDHDRALEYHEKALGIRKRVLGEEHSDTVGSYNNIGAVYFEQKQYAKAVGCCRKAFRGIKGTSKYPVSLKVLKNFLFYNPPDKAFLRDTLSLAMDTVERARQDMSSMKDDLLKEALPVYYFGVDFEAKNKKPAKAFEYSEALRSRGFLDQMGTEAALRLDGVTDGDRQRVQELVSRISAARAELERQGSMTKQERDEARYKKSGDELSKAEKELALLDEEIGRRVPAYAQLRNPKPVDVKSAQKWCGKKRAVLEYVLWSPDIAGDTDTKNADIGSYCIVLTQKGVTAVRLDGDYDYAAAVNKLRNKVSGRKQEYQFEQERNELYKHLVAPVLSKLSGIEELVIVPDGCLSFLPFDILRKKEGAKCLGDQYAISFSPSVSVSVIADTHKERTESVLAFGGAWYDKTLSEAEHRRTLRGEGTRGAAKGADRGSLSTDFALTADNDAQLAYMRSHIREYGPGDYFAKLTWQDLPGTVKELDTLKNFVFTSGSYDERMQESATEAELKKLSSSGKLRDYAVLHLACHGYFDRNIADMSSVLFSEVSGKLSGSSQDDGYLTIPETAVLSLDADMVCLSACETGLGEVKRGDGMVGLSRAFMVAGADRVGVSLWCIDDEATAEFMTLMYQKVMQEGKSYSRAYREVKAEFRRSEDFDHPYYWAAFVLYE